MPSTVWPANKAWWALVLLAVLGGTPAVADDDQAFQAEADDSETSVAIPDAALRQAVEKELGKAPGDPVTQGEMANLRTLRSEGVQQLDGIEHAVNLTEFHSRYGAIANLAPLAGLTSLTTLDLHGNEIVELGPLSNLTSLRSLSLGNDTVRRISHSTRWTRVRSVGGNGVSDLTPLSGLTSLRELDLTGQHALSDLTPLAGLTSLRTLDLTANVISDATPLSGLTSLRILDLTANALTDVAPLAGLASLGWLDLSANAISDVAPLAGSTSLLSLFLGFNTISDVAPLADLPLSTLDLSGNAISDVSSLADFTSLTALVLDHNTISDLAPLASLTSLTRLSVAHNALWDLAPLAGLTSLRTLNLSFNVLSDVSSLAGLTSLTSLSLAENPISDMAPLSGLTSLWRLRLFRTKVDDISFLADMERLTDLVLSNNDISDVSSLAGLTSLNSLSLRATLVSDVSPLVANDGLTSGDNVDLNGTPLDEDSRETHIPTLLQRGVSVNFDAEPTGVEEIADVGLRGAVRNALLADHNSIHAPSVLVLDVVNRGIDDLTGLEGAAGDLRRLFLDRNRITDIAPLGGLRFLRELTLGQNTVEDWTPLAGMDSLYLLSLDGNSLHELPALPSGLAYLYVADNSISDIDDLADMRDLEELDVSGNAITSLDPLAGIRLRYLHASDNEVADLSPVVSSRLRELHVRNNAVRDISPLLISSLDRTQLLMVDVRRNPLRDDALRVLEALRERRVTVLAGETVPYFPAAGGGRQGLVRIVNRNDEAGHVFIEAVDDAGVRVGPVRLDVGARQAVHFNSADLEHGTSKGLGGIGAPTTGDWRLSVISALDVEVLSYIRSEDGFITAMHDVLPDEMAPFFNPASNERQRSILRVVNMEAEPARWTTGGYDDHGNWHPMAGSLLVRPQHALTLAASALENHHGLGDGQGKWRLRVRGFPWFAMSLLESPTGHLTNLSTAPAHVTPLADGASMYRLPMFPARGSLRKGFVRVINRSDSSGDVSIHAVDDEGTRFGPVHLTMRPLQAVYFDSADLEAGNAVKGLIGGVGVGVGDWRLEIASELDLMALSYARTADGFLTSMHDLAPVAEDGSHRVVFFNPGSNTEQMSKLRLINDGERRADVTIDGIDDAGNGSGTVTFTLPAGLALMFPSAELEAGSDRLGGGLGDGEGRWRLRVRSDEPIAVMSLLETPGGLLTNLSTGTAD